MCSTTTNFSSQIQQLLNKICSIEAKKFNLPISSSPSMPTTFMEKKFLHKQTFWPHNELVGTMNPVLEE